MIDLESIGIRVPFTVAGLFGSVLLVGKKAAQSLPQTALSIMGGAASANYLTPVVLKITKLDASEPDAGYAIAFLLGFAGLRFVEFASERLIGEEKKNDAPDRTKRRH